MTVYEPARTRTAGVPGAPREVRDAMTFVVRNSSGYPSTEGKPGLSRGEVQAELHEQDPDCFG